MGLERVGSKFYLPHQAVNPYLMSDQSLLYSHSLEELRRLTKVKVYGFYFVTGRLHVVILDLIV